MSKVKKNNKTVYNSIKQNKLFIFIINLSDSMILIQQETN